MTRSQTSLAKPISWVTTTIVMPSFARSDEFNQGQAPYAIAMSNECVKANPEIVEIFDAAIDKLVADGTMEKLLSGEKYGE